MRQEAEREGIHTNQFACPDCREPFTAETNQSIKDMRCSHVVHNMLDKVLMKRQAKLEKAREPLQPHVKTLETLLGHDKEALNILIENNKRLEKDAKKARNEILEEKARFQKIVTDELERRTALLLGQLDRNYMMESVLIKKQQTQVEDQIQRTTAALNSVKDLLENASYEEVTTSKNQVEQTVNKVKVERQDSKQVKLVNESKIKYQRLTQTNDDKIKKTIVGLFENVKKWVRFELRLMPELVITRV